MSDNEWMYSSNEERWSEGDTYATREEAIVEATQQADIDVGAHFWTGVMVPITPAEMAHAIVDSDIEEAVALYLCDNVGRDFADEFDIPKAKLTNLRETMLTAVESWFRSNPDCMPTCFKIEQVESHVMGEAEEE